MSQGLGAYSPPLAESCAGSISPVAIVNGRHAAQQRLNETRQGSQIGIATQPSSQLPPRQRSGQAGFRLLHVSCNLLAERITSTSEFGAGAGQQTSGGQIASPMRSISPP
jgi:hypothetical protein